MGCLASKFLCLTLTTINITVYRYSKLSQLCKESILLRDKDLPVSSMEDFLKVNDKLMFSHHFNRLASGIDRGYLIWKLHLFRDQCDSVFFNDKFLPVRCQMFTDSKGYFWFYLMPFLITLTLIVSVTFYVLTVINKHQQQDNQQRVNIPRRNQVGTIETVSGSLPQRRILPERVVQLNNWIQESGTLETAKRMLSANISTLVVLTSMLPTNFVFCYMYLSGTTCEQDPIFIRIMEVGGTAVPITFLVYIGLAEKKLEKIKQISLNL